MSRRRTRPTAWLAGALALLLPAGASAFCRLTTEAPSPTEACSGAGTALRWDGACISYSAVERSASEPPFDDVRDAIDRSFGSWQAVDCDGSSVRLSLRQTVELSRCAEPEHSPSGGNTNSIIFLDDWAERELPRDAFGLTLIWHSPETGEIFDADMQLNELMGEFTVCGQRCGSGQVDLENVITHEAGHFLGLGHARQPTAAMFGESSVGETRKRTLNGDDSAGLCAIFGAEDGEPLECTAADYTPIGGLEPDCYTPSEDCTVGDVGARAGGLQPVSATLLSLLLAGLFARRRRARA